MEENNNIFLAGGDALMYLAEPTHKKYSAAVFGAINLVRMYLMTNFSTSLPKYISVNSLDDLLPFP